MTNEQKLEVIRKACVAANPEIMELKFGCLIKTKDGIQHYGQGLEDSNDGGFRSVDEGCGCCSNNQYYDKGQFEILGREIRLADVLLAIQAKYQKINGYVTYLVGSNGTFYEQEGLCGSHQELDYWNLLKDSLTDQSEECIEFLYNLLK